MGNYSKNPQAAFQEATQKGYTRVRFQQGKPILERELNLLADLVAPHSVLRHYVGSGVPEGSDAFKLTNFDRAQNDFRIAGGRCVVDGVEVVLNSDTTYKNQPHKGRVRPLPVSSTLAQWHLFLRVFAAEVNEAQDPDLRNSGDIGFETALRERVEWEVFFTEDWGGLYNAPGHLWLGIFINFLPSGPPPPPSEESLSATQSADFNAALPPGAAARLDTIGKQLAERAETRTNATTTGKSGSAIQALPPPPDDEEDPGLLDFLDLRPKGLTLKRVRELLDSLTSNLNMIFDGGFVRANVVKTASLLDNAVTTPKIQNASVTGPKLAAAAVGFSHLNASLIANHRVSLAGNTTTTLTLVPKASQGVNAYVLLNVFGDGNFTWTERLAAGDRVLDIKNSAAPGTPAIEVNVRALLIL